MSLSEADAKKAMEAELPDVKLAAWIRYRDIYLFRVVFPSPFEADFDPFFAVDAETGVVSEFSVLTDGDISEISQLFAQSQSR